MEERRHNIKVPWRRSSYQILGSYHRKCVNLKIPPLRWDAGLGGEDEENWKLVLFIRHLLELTAEEIALMKEVNRLEEEAESEGHPASQETHAQ